MKKIEQFATRHPVAFGFVITFIHIVMMIVSSILGNLWPGDETYAQPGNIVGRLISILIFLILLSRLGWLRSAGFTTLGLTRIWFIGLPLLAYSIASLMYALTGNFGFSTSIPPVLVITFILIHAFSEEVVFRGLILQALVRAGSRTRVGIIKSVLVSALFFGSLHLLDILNGRPASAVLLQSLEAFFLGVLLGALVLRGKSIYPAVVLHMILNVSGYLLIGGAGLEPASSSWLVLGMLMIPPAIYGLYLLNMSYHPLVGEQTTSNIREAL